MSELQRTPGRHVTRRLTEPSFWLRHQPVNKPGDMAEALADLHLQAVQQYGSNSGGYHAFDPKTMTTAGVFESGSVFPDGTVVSDLAWGRITTTLAQRLLEYDGVV
jgi:hypothetical protein